jgi:hypothetical protein
VPLLQQLTWYQAIPASVIITSLHFERPIFINGKFVPLVSALYAWLVLGLLFSFTSTMASHNTTPRIVELAAQISTSVAQLQEHLSAQGAPTPSFAEDSPENLPADVSHLKDAVLDATAELHELLMDPLLLLYKFAAVSPPQILVNSLMDLLIPDLQSGQHRCNLPLPHPGYDLAWWSDHF